MGLIQIRRVNHGLPECDAKLLGHVTSSLLPCTILFPRLTLVSDGYPLRRLLVSSKEIFLF